MALPSLGIPTLVALGAALFVSPRANEPTSESGAARLFERVIERAQMRAETEMLAGRDFWVDHSTWENAWVVESEHYSVRTTASRYVAEKIGRDLDYMLTQFQDLLATDFVPARRFEVRILPSIGAYNAAGQNSDEHSTWYGSFVDVTDAAQPIITYYSSNSTELGMWVTHSALHQYLNAAFGRSVSPWVVEGLAGYFALFWDWSWGAVRLTAIKSAGSDMSLLNLFQTRAQQYSEEHVIALGMVFKYLLHYHEGTRTPEEGESPPEASFAAFLRAVVRGGNGRGTGFSDNVLRNDLNALNADFQAFEF